MWSAALLAALFATWRWTRILAARIDIRVANAMLIKLVRAGDLDRARKLCRAAPRSVYLASARAALDAPDDPRPAFEDAFGRAIAPYEAARWMDVAALLAGLLAVVIAATTARVSVPALVVGAA